MFGKKVRIGKLAKSGSDSFETTLDDGSEEYDLIVEFDYDSGEERSYDSPGHPGSVDITTILNADTKEEMSLSGFSKEQILELTEEATQYLNDKAEGLEAEYVDHKMDEMRERDAMNFASTEEAIQYLADQLGKKVIVATEDETKNRKFLRRGPQDGTGPNNNTSTCPIAAEEETEEAVVEEEGQETYLKETMIDDTHKLVLEDEKDGKYEVEIYEITDSGQNVVKEFSFTRLEEAQAKYDELLPQEEEEPQKEEEPQGEGKMAEDLVFANSDEALQHLANLTGKKVMVAGGSKATFPCPNCGTKVLEQTKYCVKCKKKVKGKE